jgi:hypothetical protein
MSAAQIGECAGGGNTAPGLATWLGLAAAPTFAVMALWTGLFNGQPDMLCTAMQGSSPVGGMTVMYLLMSAFHATPWLKLMSGGEQPPEEAAVHDPMAHPLPCLVELSSAVADVHQ